MNKKIVQVKLKKDLKIEEREGLRVLKHKDSAYEIEVDMDKSSVEELLNLFKADDLLDISISSTPLEEIIKEILEIRSGKVGRFTLDIAPVSLPKE